MKYTKKNQKSERSQKINLKIDHKGLYRPLYSTKIYWDKHMIAYPIQEDHYGESIFHKKDRELINKPQTTVSCRANIKSKLEEIFKTLDVNITNAYHNSYAFLDSNAQAIKHLVFLQILPDALQGVWNSVSNISKCFIGVTFSSMTSLAFSPGNTYMSTAGFGTAKCIAQYTGASSLKIVLDIADNAYHISQIGINGFFDKTVAVTNGLDICYAIKDEYIGYYEEINI